MEKQQLSALIDGELAFSEGCESVANLLHNSAGGGLVGRYQLYGAAMRGEMSLVNLNGLFERIHDSIAAEPTVLAPAATAETREKEAWWGRLTVGGAIAASVAMLVVVGVTRLEAPGTGNQLVSASDDSSSVPMTSGNEEMAIANFREADPEDVNRYLVDHGDFGSNGSLMPLATMVSYDGF